MKIVTNITKLITQLQQPILWGLAWALGMSVMIAGVFLARVSPLGGSIAIALGLGSLVLEYKLASHAIQKDAAERSERIRIWEDKREIYTALRNHPDFTEVSKGDLDAINRLYDLRDRWYSLTGFSQEERLLLISAGYPIEAAGDVYAKLDIEALKIQTELSR